MLLLHHPATYLCIYNHASERSQIQSNTALTECPPCQHRLPSSLSKSVSPAVFSPHVQLWGISSYFRRLSVELQHFGALWPSPITSQAFLRMTPPSHSNTPSCSLTAIQSPPLAISLYNMSNKVITTAEGKRRVWMKWAGRQKSSVCKEICFCQAGAEVRPRGRLVIGPCVLVTRRAVIKPVLKCFRPNGPAPYFTLKTQSQLCVWDFTFMNHGRPFSMDCDICPCTRKLGATELCTPKTTTHKNT